MANFPLVSVIVVSYNHAKFIRENLDSIQNQTYKNIQLILGDDASTDDSVEVYKDWLKTNSYSAELKFHKINTGLATMLNECIAMAKGKYIKLIAADDFLSRDYISRCVGYLETNDKDAVFTNAFAVDDQSLMIQDHYFPKVHYTHYEEMIRLLLKSNFAPGSTLFFKAEFFKSMGPIPNDVLLEDYHFALAIANKQKMLGYLIDSLVYYRRHEGNVSQQRFFFLETMTIVEQLKFDKKGAYADIINENIFYQIFEGNTTIGQLSPYYQKYKGKKIKLLFAIRHPKFYIRLFKLKQQCFPS